MGNMMCDYSNMQLYKLTLVNQIGSRNEKNIRKMESVADCRQTNSQMTHVLYVGCIAFYG